LWWYYISTNICFWTLSIILSLSKNTILFIFQNTTFRRRCVLKNKQDGMMAIIGRWPTLQRKCFTCITCMCCLVRDRTLVFKICLVKSNRNFWLIRILLWDPLMVVFLHSRSSVLCWSCMCGWDCGVLWMCFGELAIELYLSERQN
jgi:hypothetical protein